MAQTGQRIDPFRNFNFLVELDGDLIAEASFTECTGLGSTTEIIETAKAVTTPRCASCPARRPITDITLKRGLTKSMKLWEWRQQIVDGNVVNARHNGSIVVFDLANRRRWRAGTSSTPGPPSGKARRSTPKATISPSTPSCWPMRASKGRCRSMLVTELSSSCPKATWTRTVPCTRRA